MVQNRTAWLVAGACQLVVGGILVALKQPVAVGILIVLVAAQALLVAAPRQVDIQRRLARVQPLVVLGLLLAGWALHV